MTIKYLPGAEPFFFQGNHIGCLLMHGFTASPQEMRELGLRLNTQGYTVLGPALAGHATKIGDLIPMRWDDWYRTATEAYDQLVQTCDAIFPIGLSLGGALALHLAAHRAVCGVVAIAAPSSMKGWEVIPLKNLSPLFHLIPTVKKKTRRNGAARTARYMVYPTAAAANMILDFFPHVMRDLCDVHAPALLIQARGDRVIPRHSMPRLHANLGSREKEMVWLERGGHLVTEDENKEIAFEHIARFIKRHSPPNAATTTMMRPRAIAESMT